MLEIDLAAISDVHIVGIGGAGMSALATVLLEKGKRVSGSDLKSSSATERLKLMGAEVVIGHSENNVVSPDLVSYSSAIRGSNSELQAATKRGIPLLNRAQLLRALISNHKVVAVAGTHGKTTTTSMLSLGLINAGIDPSFVIGGELNEVGASAHFGQGELFVVEADESDGTFLQLGHHIGIVTNVEEDHLDYYGDMASLVEAFRCFIGSAELSAIVCADDEIALALAEEVGAVTYGTSESARFMIRNLALAPHLTSYELFEGSRRIGQVDLPIVGVHNARNSAAAIVAGLLAGAEFSAMADAMARFTGVSRRFQHRRIANGVRYVDDYGHLPTEIRATLLAARQAGPERLVVIFQPHRYSRTRFLAKELGEALTGADLVIVADVYGAGEDPIPGIDGELVFAAAQALIGNRVLYHPSRSSLAEFVAPQLRAGDMCLTLGAGDITLLEMEITDLLAKSVPEPQ